MNDRLRVVVDTDQAQQVPTDAFIYYQAACASASATETAGLVIAGQARHAIDAAIALYRNEAQLRAIQAWTGMEFEWSWCGQAPASTTHDFVLTSSTDNAQHLLLDLPASRSHSCSYHCSPPS